MSNLKHILKESGLCLDWVRLLDWVRQRSWRRVLFFRFLRLRFSPAVLGNALAQTDKQERGRLFSLGISQINVGRTYKTSGFDRTNLVDKAILHHVAGIPKPLILDVGASDGSASLFLLERVPDLGSMVLADVHPCFHYRGVGPVRVYYDGAKRLLGCKILFAYINLAPGSRISTRPMKVINTLNPLLRGRDRLKGLIPFDIFKDRLDQPVHVIKCANVLNLEYYPPEKILAALDNLRRSLTDKGLLFLSQNNAAFENDETYLVLRINSDGGWIVVEERDDHPWQGLIS